MPKICLHLMKLLVLFPLLLPSYALKAEQTYAFSPTIRDLATKNKVDERLGAPKDSPLFNDTLTAIDLIAKERAKVLHRENRVDQEDYEAAGWMLCVMPWTPPKLPAEQSEMKKLRPLLVNGVFTSEARRAKLIQLVDRSRLALSGDQIKEQGLRPSDFFNTKRLEKN